MRRGWLGVKIQQVTDEIAESLNIKPARGALVAGVDDKGPAKPAGIEAGDVIIKFDGKDIKEMRDLPRIVADTPVGKDVEVIDRPQGQGREEDRAGSAGSRTARSRSRPRPSPSPPEEKSVVQKTLGLQLSNMTDELRKRYKIKRLDQGRGHHRRRCSFGRGRQAAGRRQRSSSRSSRSRWRLPPTCRSASIS